VTGELPALTDDAFLGGRLRLFQPARGYRAGVDAVLLAAAVPARSSERVLELGCGVGAVTLCLAARVSGLSLFGVEVQRVYAALAQRNAARAGVALTLVEADLADLPEPVRGVAFDHVIANPPFHLRTAGLAAQDPGREHALAETTPLAIWIDVARRRLRPGGCLTLIQRVERLPELLQCLDDNFGAVELRPIAPRAGRSAGLVVLRARKGRRTPLRLLPPFVLHRGQAHECDGGDYTAEASEVLRSAAPLPWPL